MNQDNRSSPPAGGSAQDCPGPASAGSGAAVLHARRLEQAENSPRIGQPPRNLRIADMDPDDVLAAVRRQAVNVREAASGNGDLAASALELAEQFGKLDEWLSDFRPLPEDWA